MWAQIVSDAVVAVSLTEPLDGWAEVTPTTRPMDTLSNTWDSGVEVADGLPVQAWTSRAWRDGELTDEYAAILTVQDFHQEYAEQIPAAIESFRAAAEKCLDPANPTGMVALETDVAAWSPSGVTADDLTALHGFIARLVAFRTWQGNAFYGGEVYGRYLFGIPVVS